MVKLTQEQTQAIQAYLQVCVAVSKTRAGSKKEKKASAVLQARFDNLKRLGIGETECVAYREFISAQGGDTTRKAVGQ